MSTRRRQRKYTSGRQEVPSKERHRVSTGRRQRVSTEGRQVVYRREKGYLPKGDRKFIFYSSLFNIIFSRNQTL